VIIFYSQEIKFLMQNLSLFIFLACNIKISQICELFSPPPPPRPQTFVPQVTSTHSLSHPYRPDYNALMDVAAKKPSNNALARDCFKIIFASKIRATDLYNVYGRTMRGSTDRKFTLDSAKVHALRCFVEDKFQQVAIKKRNGPNA
jgi:hypothetical protein